MQDQFVGDIGDFGKYGLLRWLTGVTSPDCEQNLRLGVVWYYHRKKGSGGNQISYLDDIDFNLCDPELHITLADMVKNDRRSVAEVECSGILPKNTLHHRDEIRNSTSRQDWLKKAAAKIRQADLIFLDPDNGFRHCEEKQSSQHIYVNDLNEFASKNLVVYHHLNRTPHTIQFRDWFRQIRGQFNTGPIWALRHQHKGIGRAYFLLGNDRSQQLIEERLKSFFNSPWAKHFMPIDTSLLQRQ